MHRPAAAAAARAQHGSSVPSAGVGCVDRRAATATQPHSAQHRMHASTSRWNRSVVSELSNLTLSESTGKPLSSLSHGTYSSLTHTLTHFASPLTMSRHAWLSLCSSCISGERSGGAPVVLAMQLLSCTATPHTAGALTVLVDRSGHVAALSSAVQLCAALLTCDTVITARHGCTLVRSSLRSSQRYGISRAQLLHASGTIIL